MARELCFSMDNFHFSWYFTIFVVYQILHYMETTVSNNLFFLDIFSEYDFTKHTGNVVHLLCLEGNLCFTSRHTRYNISPHDYVILTNGVFVSAILQPEECKILLMSFADSCIEMNAIRSNYGIIGHLSLLQNPVMKLSPADFNKCKEDMLRLRERINDKKHLFREEMIGALLQAHVLDLYDIHARTNEQAVVSSRPATLLRDFIEMLIDGDYISDRSLEYYASCLCITPHYLSEISKNISGKPATYWIDRFVSGKISHLLLQANLSLEDIADIMNFSSVPYLSRYVKNKTGLTPSEFRRNFKH